MQTQRANAVQVITLGLAVVIALAFLFYLPSVVDKRIDKVEDKIANIPAPVVEIPDYPTAEEIAAAIPDKTSKQLQEIWEEIYADEVEELKEAAVNVCADEFEWSELEDLLKAKFGDISEIQFVDYDEDDTEITILDLGLDDEDDREVRVTGNFRVSYLPEEGEQIEVIKKVYGNCHVTSDDGELEAELSLRV